MLTHQLVFGQMNGHDFKLEELLAPKAVGLACHGFDLVAGPLHDAVGDGEQPSGEQANLVLRQRLAQVQAPRLLFGGVADPDLC